MVKRGFILLLIMVLLCTATGCASLGGDIATQLRPPKASGEEGYVEKALGVYIEETFKQENYTLKYPRTGEYRSAFILEDMDSDGQQEAIVFYALVGDTEKVHINLLRQTGGEWRSVNDREVTVSDIHSVCFGDMDGDGVRELFVGWTMFSDRAYQLSVYALNGNRIAERFTSACATMAVADLTKDGKDDCLLFTADAQLLTATLWAMQDGEMVEVGYSLVDGYVQRMEQAYTVPLSDDTVGVFVDCVKSGDVLVTQLLYWESGRLVAPFYDETQGGNTQTVRPADIPSGDVDEDGQWEWPTGTLLTEHEADVNGHTSTCYLTEFWSWDQATAGVIKKFSCIYNSTDRYYLLVDDMFVQQYATRYDMATKTLWIDTRDTGEAVFAVRAVTAGSDPAEETDTFRPLLETRVAEYRVWLREDGAFNAETLQYMLNVF